MSTEGHSTLQVRVRMPRDLLDEVSNVAARNGRGLSQEISAVLRVHIEREWEASSE